MKLVQLEEHIEKMIREVVDAALKSAGSNALMHGVHILGWLEKAKLHQEEPEQEPPKE